MGFLTIDRLADEATPQPATLTVDRRSGAVTGSIRIGGRQALLVKPLSFMNLSGDPIGKICRFFKIPVEQLIVVHDELDLDLGVVRIKQGGGDNGHNGLKSITRVMGSPNYIRVRVGISRPPHSIPPADWVLRPIPAADREALSLAVATAAEAVELVATAGLAHAQNTIHAR